MLLFIVKQMKLYEMIFVVRNELGEDQVNSIAENFLEFIKGNGGEIKFQHYFGVRSLAYEIQRNKKGHYYLVHFTAAQSFVKELDREIKLNESVIRHMIVNIEHSDPDSVLSMLTVKDRDVESSEEGVFTEKGRPNPVSGDGYRAKSAPVADDSKNDAEAEM